jgi:dTDP-4-dehydrorhamnose reductase
MYGLKMPPRKGMIETLVEALRGGRPLSRFADQFFTPVYTGQFSEIVLRLMDRGARGLLHVGGEKISRLAFAQSVADVFAPGVSIDPVPFKQIEGIARRPRDSSLASRCIEERYGIDLPRVRSGLERLRKDWQFSRGGNDQ